MYSLYNFYGATVTIKDTFIQWRRKEFENCGHRSSTKVGGAPKYFCWSCPFHLFGYKSTIGRFGERFRGGQYSLASFLFAVLLFTVPTVPRHL